MNRFGILAIVYVLKSQKLVFVCDFYLCKVLESLLRN